MNYFKSFSEALKSIKERDFDKIALELFQWQALHNPVYFQFLEAMGADPKNVSYLEDIPFIPIEFFKSHKVYCSDQHLEEGFFSSSGTTGMQQSKHYYWSMEFYLSHCQRLFESQYGPIDEIHVLALLPSYLEREGSSLIAMADHFIKLSGSPHSGFYLNEHEELLSKLENLCQSNKKVLLLGVTFALLDLAEKVERPIPCPQLILMDTGGMKGRRREMIREEVHGILKSAFGVEAVHSEYGMTELMSQAYAKGEGKFNLPFTMKAFIRDPYDPYALLEEGKVGAINLIDLANFHSCAFLATQDLGKLDKQGQLEVLGRMDNSDIRGCNLLVSG
ncbi:LuxE/PaaK family acyltransferase [Pleomorphovibrio marinus]|uniref:LuxE/PaaK family acyltransferase n=1 Tax=Pleomorphovibrio marinus TaxID=2164132 RepID=UPI000E0BDE94|nr:acyl transferase [Pleomorphovibrio marinus]